MKPKRKSGQSEPASKESPPPRDDRPLDDPVAEQTLDRRVAELERLCSSMLANSPAPPSRSRMRLVLVLLFLAFLLPQLFLWFALGQRHDEERKEHLFWTLCHGTATREGRAEAFFELIEHGNTEWRSARLHDLDLSDKNLEGMRLEWASLERSDLSRSKLAKARLSGSSFRRSTLESMDLSGAQMRGAQCDGASMENSDLRGADLRGASLRGAQLVGCDLRGADLTAADLRQAELTGARLSGASLRSARLDRIDFTGAVLEKVDLSEANWWRTSGLPQETINLFQTKFRPSAQAEPAFRADYREWLQRAPE